MNRRQIKQSILLVLLFLIVFGSPLYAKVIPSDKLAIEMTQWAVKKTVMGVGVFVKYYKFENV